MEHGGKAFLFDMQQKKYYGCSLFSQNLGLNLLHPLSYVPISVLCHQLVIPFFMLEQSMWDLSYYL